MLEKKREKLWTLGSSCVCVLFREFLTFSKEHTESDFLIDVHSICSRKNSAHRGSTKSGLEVIKWKLN